MQIELKKYAFERASHFAAGVWEGFGLDASGLSAPAQYTLEALPGTGPDDAAAVLAFDPSGSLHWLRARGHELVRALPDGILVLGQLSTLRGSQALSPEALAVGLEHLWLLVRPCET